MKPLIGLVVLATLMACSVPVAPGSSAAATSTTAASAKGKVVLSFGKSASTGSRSLSASTEIQKMEVQWKDLTGSEGTTVQTVTSLGSSVTLSLTADHTYEVAFVVYPQSTQSLPGFLTAVVTYGDAALVTPVAGQTQTVSLYVRPLQTNAYQTYLPNTNNRVYYVDPNHDGLGYLSVDGDLTTDFRSRFFDGYRGQLYFFDYGSGTIYRWSDPSVALGVSNSALVEFNGLFDSDFSVAVYAVAAAPLPSGNDAFYAVALREDQTFHLYYVNPSGETTLNDVGDITSALQAGFAGETLPQVTPTALTVDPVTGDVYVASTAFGAYNDSESDWRLRSSILRFTPLGSGSTLTATAAYGMDAWFDANGAQSIFRDLVFQGGEVLALGSPSISEGNQTNYSVGTATVLRLTPALGTIGALGTPSATTRTANSALPDSSDGTLQFPYSFGTGGYGATVYVNQLVRMSDESFNWVLSRHNLVTGAGEAMSIQELPQS